MSPSEKCLEYPLPTITMHLYVVYSKSKRISFSKIIIVVYSSIIFNNLKYYVDTKYVDIFDITKIFTKIKLGDVYY